MRSFLLLVLMVFLLLPQWKLQAKGLDNNPAYVKERKNPSDTPRIVLTEQAKQSVGIETKVVPADKRGQRELPISSLFFSPSGSTWVFIEEPILEFHREKIEVVSTLKDKIIIKAHFKTSVPIVTNGVVELSGIEAGIGQ